MAWVAIDPGGSGAPGSMPDQQMIAIGCARSEHHLCTQIPGMNIGKDSIWRAPLSWPAYVAFRAVWSAQPIEEHPALTEWARLEWARVQDAYRLRAMMDATNPWVLSALRTIESRVQQVGDQHRELFPFQRGGTDWLVTMGRIALTDPQGNGKTPQVIRALQVLAPRSLPALMICSPAVLREFAREFADWAPELSVKIVAGTALRRRQALETPTDVTLIAWPNVRLHTRLAAYPGVKFARCAACGGEDPKVTMGRCDVHLKELNDTAWQTVIADEAHHMKDAKSKQTRAVWWLAHHARYFWPVTGTPVGDNIADLWPILHGLDPKAWPAKSRYLDLYAEKRYAWHGGVEILDIRADTAASYHASVQPLMRRIPKELARPQMPSRLPEVFRYPEMSPAQAKIYKELKKQALAELAGVTLVPGNSVVKFTRLCQLASSMIEMTEGEDPYGFTRHEVGLVLPSSKADDLLDFLADNPGQLITVANSPRLIGLAEQKLAEHKITSVKLVGGQDYETRDQAVRWFQDGKVQVIFLTAGTGGESITLTASDTVYFMQPQPSFRTREQVIGRADRIGQRNAVRVVNALTPGTVEPGLYQLGREKAERAGSVTRDPDLLRWIIEAKEEDHDSHLAE